MQPNAAGGPDARGAVSPDPATIPTPTPTHYQQVAAQLGATLAEIAAQIPRFEGSHPSTADFVRRHQNVPLDFVATVTAAVETSPELQATKKFDVVEARDTLQFVDAFRPVLDQLTALSKDLKFTIDARKAKVVMDGLQMYHIAKGVARDPNSPDVAAHVQNMRRDLGRAGRRTRAKPAPTKS